VKYPSSLLYVVERLSKVTNIFNNVYILTTKIESIETQLEILKGVAIVLIGILETEGVLSLENSDKLDRVRYAASLDSIHEDRK